MVSVFYHPLSLVLGNNFILQPADVTSASATVDSDHVEVKKFNYTHCRHMTIWQDEGVLSYDAITNPSNIPVGQFIGKCPLTKECCEFSIRKWHLLFGAAFRCIKMYAGVNFYSQVYCRLENLVALQLVLFRRISLKISNQVGKRDQSAIMEMMVQFMLSEA